MVNSKYISFALFFGLLGLLKIVEGAVLGIDFGSEFMKISIITPGKPFSIIEDTTSKRKTYSAVFIIFLFILNKSK